MKALIVDDDDFAITMLDRTLAHMGYDVVSARDGKQALEILRNTDIRLVITDWDMPVMNGVDLCRAVRREELSGYVYIIMLTGREGAKQRIEGLCAGADDFLNKPLDPEELLVCLKTAERILSLETRDLALFALAKLAESRDSETGAHIERVQSYTRIIAQHLSPEVKSYYGVDEEYIRLLYQTSPLHDLGKVGIPDAILLKPGKLTPDEFEVMKTHTLLGARTLDAALEKFPNARFLELARNIAATHHEKFDGSGYPNGLVATQIPLCGRIVAVADVYDALTSRRIYKDASSHEDARAIIVKDRGSHFDPEVVDAFLRAEAQILVARERLKDNVEPGNRQITIPAAPLVTDGGPVPCKILVAEDEPLLLARLTQLLAATGELVFAASNGEEAMRIFMKERPRVVVSDWEMPGLDGVELCRRIHTLVEMDQAHFIMLTAHSDKGHLLDAYGVGVDDFVSKPFDPEELLVRVRAGIRAAKLRDNLHRKASGSQALNAQLAIANSRLERLAITDELTGAFNRRHALLRLDEHWELAESRSWPLTIAMVDIDHFKSINDTYGHDCGDTVLRHIAAILRDQTRGTDFVCRVGGEEFLIIFPSQTLQEGIVCAERCRSTVESYAFVVAGAKIKVTVSIGLATRERGMADYNELTKAADQALYAAKHGGRNIIHVADHATRQTLPTPTSPPVIPVAPPQPPIDFDAVLQRCGGDKNFAAAVSAKFQAQAGGEVAKIETALASGDAETLRRTAHSLKSMAAFMAADTASQLAHQIEELGAEKQFADVTNVLAQLRTEVDRATAWIAEHSNTGAISREPVATPADDPGRQ